jgi:predicted alpha/beta superfamily hydrolase
VPVALLAAACLSVPGPAIGQGSAAPIERETEPVVIGERFTVHSEVLGEDRTLLVATPDGYETAASARYPVLYLLDGDGHFHHATGVVDFLADNGRMPRVIVVAIPNPSQDARTRDLTPEHRAELAFPDMRADSVFPTAGGADTFLRFLRDELAPLIDREYRTAPFRILVGHSFGALFNIHALLADPEAFQAHIAISPSLWWDERRLVEQADAFFDDLASSVAGAAEATETPEDDLAEAAPDGIGDGASGPHAFLYMTMGNEGGAMLRGAWGLSGVLEEKAPPSFEWQFALMEEALWRLGAGGLRDGRLARRRATGAHRRPFPGHIRTVRLRGADARAVPECGGIRPVGERTLRGCDLGFRDERRAIS